jgi:hypothetical protein
MWLCANCGLAQLRDDAGVSNEERGQEPAALVEQARSAVETVASSGLLPSGGTVIEFGSPHGGSWLEHLLAVGLQSLPEGSQVDVIVDCFGMMHDAEQAEAITYRANRLKPSGHLLVQIHSVATILAQGQWNALRHGHFAYYSATALRGLFGAVGLSLADSWSFDLYGGTVLLDFCRKGVRSPSVDQLLAMEAEVGVADPRAYQSLQDSVDQSSAKLRTWLETNRTRGKSIVGYGAASRAVSLLHRAGIGPDLLPAIADASSAKRDRRMPGTGISIQSVETLLRARPDLVLVFVPDMVEEVRRSLPEVEKWGGRFAVPLPEPRVIPMERSD